MQKKYFETLIGATILFLAAFFLYFAKDKAGLKKPSDTYLVIAKFEKIDGITSGSEVRLSGIKIGSVTNTALDQKTYQAVLTLAVDQKYNLPTDSSAQISSEGLIGGKYLSLTAGSEENFLKNGDEIKYTQSPVNIETLIGKMIYNNNSTNQKQ